MECSKAAVEALLKSLGIEVDEMEPCILYLNYLKNKLSYIELKIYELENKIDVLEIKCFKKVKESYK